MGLLNLLQVLAKPPEGGTAEELGQWMWRRTVLRGLMVVAILPIVLFFMVGVPWLREAYEARYGDCVTLIPAADVEAIRGVELYDVRAWPRDDGCRAAFKVQAPAGHHPSVLEVERNTERTVEWRLTLITRGTDKSVDTWDWDRPEHVHVVTEPRGRRRVLIGTDDPGYIELGVEDATDEQVLAFVQQVLEVR